MNRTTLLIVLSLATSILVLVMYVRAQRARRRHDESAFARHGEPGTGRDRHLS